MVLLSKVTQARMRVIALSNHLDIGACGLSLLLFDCLACVVVVALLSSKRALRVGMVV